MLNNRLAAARLVATKLTAVEEAVDDALISASELTSSFAQARRQANISPVVGQDAIALAAEATAALQLARAKFVEAHHALAEVRDGIGLRTVAAGDLWKLAKPSASLTVVSDAA